MGFDWSQAPEEILKEEASSWADAIYSEGEDGFCPVEEASWEFRAEFPVAEFSHLMEQGADGWKNGSRTNAGCSPKKDWNGGVMR